ncbi:MAG: patatin family protein [Eubacteriales bacterium]|nr:patatin family protein [Eubacteriales bacterium]
MKQYERINELPSGNAGDTIQPGCLVLEGGGWRGLYTIGALDALMEADINFQTVVGVSAGALSAVGYLSGQIGWAGRIDLTYRNDPKYVDVGAIYREHGVMGLHYLFHDLVQKHPIDMERFNSLERELVAVVTNMETGKPEYFRKNQCDIFEAVIASASVPYVSEPIMIDGKPYLDGGCSVKIAYQWAKEHSFEKIAVICTRERGHRREEKDLPQIAKFHYRSYPNFVNSLEYKEECYNRTLEEMERDESMGQIFTLYPETPVTVSRFE